MKLNTRSGLGQKCGRRFFFFFNDMAVSYTIEKAIVYVYDENERIKTNFEDLEIKIGDEQ